MDKPKLLDLYCCAGGAGMGFHRAGFRVVGVDKKKQPHYPFEFYQCDAMQFLLEHGHEYDYIHASPECQEYSVTRSLKTTTHSKDIPELREMLIATGKPYDIENVPGAPLINYVLLCGTMFGLRVIRHRMFETSWGLHFSPMACNHNGKASGNRNVKGVTKNLQNFRFLTIAGNDYIAGDGRIAMDIDWMTRKELSQAIPPAYTYFVGRRWLETSLLSNTGSSRLFDSGGTLPAEVILSNVEPPE